MKYFHYSYLIFISLIFWGSCKNPTSTNASSNRVIDSLESVISNLEHEINRLKENNSVVQVINKHTSTCNLSHFKPIGLTIKVNNVRPSFDENTFLCVPAAFTSLNHAIDGYFMKEGMLINDSINNNINGYIIFNEEGCVIDSIKNLASTRLNIAKEKRYNIFQQFLLVKNSKLVKCQIFGNNKNVRRTIGKYPNGDIFIAESDRPMSILEFQTALIEIGVEDALYLDMGSYSEGWYKSCAYEKIKIGESFINTAKQTNWLTFERKEN